MPGLNISVNLKGFTSFAWGTPVGNVQHKERKGWVLLFPKAWITEAKDKKQRELIKRHNF